MKVLQLAIVQIFFFSSSLLFMLPNPFTCLTSQDEKIVYGFSYEIVFTMLPPSHEFYDYSSEEYDFFVFHLKDLVNRCSFLWERSMHGRGASDDDVTKPAAKFIVLDLSSRSAALTISGSWLIFSIFSAPASKWTFPLFASAFFSSPSPEGETSRDFHEDDKQIMKPFRRSRFVIRCGALQIFNLPLQFTRTLVEQRQVRRWVGRRLGENFLRKSLKKIKQFAANLEGALKDDFTFNPASYLLPSLPSTHDAFLFCGGFSPST